MSESQSKLSLELTDELVAALDAWRGLQLAMPEREAAVLQLLAMALEEAAMTAVQTPDKP